VRALGLDLGGTDVKLALVEDGTVVETRTARAASEDERPDAVLRRVAELGRSAGAVDSIGVALPGLFDEDGTAILLPNLRGDWTGRPIREPLEDGLGAPVRLVNDGHAFVLAEASLGSGRGAANVLGIVCGTGIGGGLVLDGRLHLGAADRAGEVGHHTVAEEGPPCACGNRGCLELYAGSRAIAHAAGRPTFAEALDRARAGEERARAAVARAGELIGLAIANVLIFVCPDRVVVGGGVAEAGALLLEPLRASVAARARVAPLERIGIVAAELGPTAGAVGAALWGAADGRARPRPVPSASPS
jgi:glucokinase